MPCLTFLDLSNYRYDYNYNCFLYIIICCLIYLHIHLLSSKTQKPLVHLFCFDLYKLDLKDGGAG